MVILAAADPSQGSQISRQHSTGDNYDEQSAKADCIYQPIKELVYRVLDWETHSSPDGFKNWTFAQTRDTYRQSGHELIQDR